MAKEDIRKGDRRKRRANGRSALRRDSAKTRRQRAGEPDTGTQGYGLAFHVIIFLIAFLIVFSRRTDALLHAQFWAEDGKNWYHDAYQFGLHSLLMPQDGYLQTLSRLIALLALLFPFHAAPLAMNLCAITVQVLPVNVFLSSRYSNLGMATRAAASFLYLAVPNSYEIHANVTNIQWHLALLACLLLLARPAGGWGWRIFDAIVLVLVSLDSATVFVLAPLAVGLWWKRRRTWPGMSFLPLVPGAVIQASSVLLSQSRPHGPDGASFARLLSILGRQVFLGSLVGMRTIITLVDDYSAHALFCAEVIAAVAGIAILLYALRYSPTELRLFILFAFAVFALCLLWPEVARPNERQWESLIPPGEGNRYFFLPMLGFLAALVWMAADRAVPRRMRYLAGAVLLLLPIGIYQDWYYPAFRNLHFPRYAAQFERAPSGTQFTIPINPDWTMQLTKR